MNSLILAIFAAAAVLAATDAHPMPTDASDGIVEHRSGDPLIFEENSFPYYGGLRGQFLHLRGGQRDGSVNTYIVAQAPQVATNRQGATAVASNVVSVSDSRGPPQFEEDFNKIQLAAARLVAIQEIAKRKGAFSTEDNKVYAASLLELGQAAQNLAKLQQTGQIKDFSILLQPDALMPQKQSLFAGSSGAHEHHGMGDQKVDEVTEQQLNGDDFLPPNAEDPYEDVNDSVAITAPKKDASVAEAKPVGLSIAGEGGVASSKPNAVALSGRNGLAVSAPKATAIAGVTPEEAAAYSIALPNRNQLVIKSTQRLSAQQPTYDDYDYTDLTPVRTLTRDTPLTRAASTTTGTTNSKSAPKATPVNAPTIAVAGATHTKAASESAANDAFINKWKTAIAEDFAAAGRSANRGAHKFLN